MTTKTTTREFIDCGECGEETRCYTDIDGQYIDCGYCGNFGYIA
jgi:ribosomal protein S27E